MKPNTTTFLNKVRKWVHCCKKKNSNWYNAFEKHIQVTSFEQIIRKLKEKYIHAGKIFKSKSVLIRYDHPGKTFF